jgi:hypothetical protein
VVTNSSDENQFLDSFIRAANQNKSVIAYRNGTEWWSSCWTEEVIARNPPLRVEFEHAIVFGSLAEARSIRDGKSNWGCLLKIEPLRCDDSCTRRELPINLRPPAECGNAGTSAIHSNAFSAEIAVS